MDGLDVQAYYIFGGLAVTLATAFVAMVVRYLLAR